MVEEKRNILIGFVHSLLLPLRYAYRVISLGIFVGFFTFFFMEKTLRVLGGEDEHGHSHSHTVKPTTGHASGVDVSVSHDGLRSRNGQQEGKDKPADEPNECNGGPSKMSAYLNLFGDFVHNM